MMNHHEWIEQAERYALGALDGEELIQFQEHLAAGCPDCEHCLREMGETLTLLPNSLPLEMPPRQIKSRLLDQIAEEENRSVQARPRTRRLGWSLGAAIAAVLLLVLGWNLVSVQRKLQTLEVRLSSLQTDKARLEEVIRFLSNPQVQTVHLTGLPPSPGATARLFWKPDAHTGYFLTTGLPVPSPGKVYELWAIAGNEPVAAGIFDVDKEGRALFRLPPLPKGKKFAKFAVTLEPSGGLQKPSGPMHLLGEL